MPDNLPKLDFQPYINPYVGSANNEFNELGKSLDVRYEANLAAMDELDMLMNNVNTLKGDAYLKDKLLADTRGQITQLREAGNWEDARNKVRELARRFNNDSVLKISQENYIKRQKLEEKVQEMKLNGKTPVFFDNPDDFTTVDPETGLTRSFSSDVEAKLDYRPDQEKLFDGIQADINSTKTGKYGYNSKRGAFEKVGYGDEWKRISNQKIIDQANRSIDGYINSSSGMQEMKILIKKENLSQDQAKEVVRKRLIAVGKEKVFSEKASSYDATPFDGTSMGLTGGKQPAPLENIGTSKSELILNRNFDPNKVSVEQDANGKITVKPKDKGFFTKAWESIGKQTGKDYKNPENLLDIVKNITNFTKNLAFNTGISDVVRNFNSIDNEKDLEKAKTEILKSTSSKVYQDLKDDKQFQSLSKANQAKKLQKRAEQLLGNTMGYQSTYEEFVLPDGEEDKKGIEAANKQLLTYRSAQNKLAWVLDRGSVSEPINFNKAISKAYGENLKDEDITKMIDNKQIVLTQKLAGDNLVTPAGYVLKVPNIDGGYRTVWIDGLEQDKKDNYVKSEIAKLRLQGGGSKKFSTKNGDITISVKPQFDEKDNFLGYTEERTK